MDTEHDSNHHAVTADPPAERTARDMDVDHANSRIERTQQPRPEQPGAEQLASCGSTLGIGQARPRTLGCRGGRDASAGRSHCEPEGSHAGARRALGSSRAGRKLLLRLRARDRAGPTHGRAGACTQRGRLARGPAYRGLCPGRADASAPTRAHGPGAGSLGAAARPPTDAQPGRAHRVDRRARQRDGARPVRTTDFWHADRPTTTNRHDAGAEDSARAPACRPACSNHIGPARAGRACIDSEVPR